MTSGACSILENHIPELSSEFLITGMPVSLQSLQTKGAGSKSSTCLMLYFNSGKGGSTCGSTLPACEVQPQRAEPRSANGRWSLKNQVSFALCTLLTARHFFCSHQFQATQLILLKPVSPAHSITITIDPAAFPIACCASGVSGRHTLHPNFGPNSPTASARGNLHRGRV